MKKLLVIIGAILILTLPWTVRYLQPETVLSVAVIDLSSATEQYEERVGIYDVLSMQKIVDDNEQPYEPDEQFYGVKVNAQKTDIDVNELPMRLEAYDLLYLADTAGIRLDEHTTGTSGQLLHAGLTNTMWRTLQSRLQQPEPVTFIAERDVFSEATEQRVQQQLASHLQLQLSGWQARYFDDLQQATMLSEQMTGSGLVFVHSEQNETFAMQYEQPLTLTFSQEGQQLFGVDEISKSYSGWFDLLTVDGATELAAFNTSFTDEQQQTLQAAGIPTTWTAVATNKQAAATNYYFAGDFSQRTKEPINMPHFLGYEALHKWLEKDDAFYWHTYIPMFSAIVEATQHHDDAVVQPVAVEPTKQEELSYNARIIGERYEVLQNGEWQQMTIKGVNIGMAKPGLFPGEAGIEKKDYKMWFETIGEMGANTIRIYTIHPPAFYEALAQYNKTHEQPIYVFHGVWIDEEPLQETLDVHGEPTENLQAEIKRVVDIIHGNAELEERPGHASGSYTADISKYVLGWMLGIEWYPHTVQGTNEANADKRQLNGQYVETKAASPFEIWLAEQLEFTAQYEAENYGWMRPLSFTNWVTTDLLEHPYEPSEDEDMVSVNPNVIYVKDAYEAVGQFASYHVYPYYPDFLNYTPHYVTYKDHRGQPNNYAAYLHELKAVHRLPILIAEFGIPASRGKTHSNPFGWDQGFMSEKQQGETIVHLFEDIVHEGMLGGLVFTWQDEWFKRTWNTMDLDNPDQRPYWSNAQTNEQQFGLLSFDRLTHKVDGDVSDWFGEKPFYEEKDAAVYMNADERYVYIRLDINDTKFSSDYYPIISLDTLKGQGNESYNGVSLPHAAEFAITLKGEQSRIEVDANYDIFRKIYGQQLQLTPFTGTLEKNSGQFNKIEFALNKPMTIPVLNRELPFEKYETGKLREGNGNPESEDYDSLADYFINDTDGIVEIRIPWLLLNVTDPGRREIWANLYDGDMSFTTTDGVGVAVTFMRNGEVQQKIPSDGSVSTFSWETWDLPKYEERLKQSYYILQQKFKDTQ